MLEAILLLNNENQKTNYYINLWGLYNDGMAGEVKNCLKFRDVIYGRPFALLAFGITDFVYLDLLCRD